MISSMTGFGRCEVRKNGFLVSVEMRSLNHRFLDVELRLPRNLNPMEREIKELIGKSVPRGRVNATLSIKGDEVSTTNLAIDKSLASTYMKLLEDLKREFKLNGNIELAQLLSFPDIISFENNDEMDDGLGEIVKSAFSLAIEDLKSMKVREGAEIRKDLEARIKKINKLIKAIAKGNEESIKDTYAKLKEKVTALTETEVVNEGRLEMEVAFLAEKADVTEECTRFQSHNTLFLELLDKSNSEGRKLNFLLQEMHREANTIGAKTNNAEVSHWVVEVKEEVEKLREQIQNIE